MTNESPAPTSIAASRIHCFAAAAFAATWLATLWRLSPSTAWRGDYAALQRIGTGAVGYEGFVSQGLSKLALAVPIGTTVQRASLTSALGAAFTAWFACLLAHRVLRAGTRRQALACWLALGTSLPVCLGNTVQSLATVAQGPCVAVALGLACVSLMLRVFAPGRCIETEKCSPPAQSDQPGNASTSAAQIGQLAASNQPLPNEFFLLGLGVVVTTLESHVVGLLLIVMTLVLWRLSDHVRLGRLPLWTLFGSAAAAAFIGAPCFVARRVLETASIEQPALGSLIHLQPFTQIVSRQSAWLEQLGSIWLTISVLGLVMLALHPQRRQYAWVFALLALAAILLPPVSERAAQEDGSPAVFGTLALAIAASMACRLGVEWFTLRRPKAFALVATLVVLAQTVTVLARNEEVHFTMDHYRSLGDEAWADEALAGLPPRALVLTRTNAITSRLILAQLAEGARPDVLIVPVDRMTDPRMTRLLLGVEPALAPTLRDLAINGKPSENALAGLSDARPLFVEFDGNWDARLREHLLVLPIFHRIYSQTLGRSDRAVALPEGQRVVARLLAITAPGSNPNLAYARDPGDLFTRAIVEARLREQLVLLLALGDRQSFETVAADYEQAFSESQWLKQLRQRVSTSTRGAVVAFDLLDPTKDQGTNLN